MSNYIDLRELLENQHKLQSQLNFCCGVGERGLKENFLHLVVELTEVLQEVNFKPWKQNVKHIDRKALATEMTDVLQFWANAALAMGITPDELTTALRDKWEVNQERLKEQ